METKVSLHPGLERLKYVRLGKEGLRERVSVSRSHGVKRDG